MKILKFLKHIHEDVVGINYRNHRLVHPYNPRKHHYLANDKAICKEVLAENGVPTPETYALVESMGDIPAALEAMNQQDAVAIKPAQGSGGGGILILYKNEAGEWTKPSGTVVTPGQLRMHLANILFGLFSKSSTDKVIIEYCLKPHQKLSEIYAQGVPDFRVIMQEDQAIMAMLRMPTDESDGKANLHAGAIGIGVDLATGKLLEGFDGRNYFGAHPDSGFEFLGMQMPEWERTMEVARRTSTLFPLDYLGIDIVFDRDFGPMVIEINVRPGIAIQNVNRQGLKTKLLYLSKSA